MTVLIVLKHRFSLWTAPDWFVEKLRVEFPDTTFIHRRSYNGIENDLRDAEIVVSWSLNAEQMRSGAKLKWIHSTAAAIHQLLIPEIVNSNIILTNARSVHGPVVAEHVLSLMFALAKHLPSATRFQQQHQWGQDAMTHLQPPLRELRDGTLGLIGVGAIGSHVARVASAMGMRVVAVRANPDKGVDWLENSISDRSRNQVHGPDGLHQMLGESDFVVLSAPVTSKTTKVIDREALTKMKPDAYLINVGRGALVDEHALAEALRSKQIGGAALDVFEQEPLPSDSPLWDLENVIVTPHQGGLSHKLWERQYKLFSENLRRYQARESLLGLVDKAAGY
jgi:phosphoglycerate dehydrogenase-like enzyme